MDIVQHESGLYNRHSTIQRSTKQCNTISNTIQMQHNVFFLGNNFRIAVITCTKTTWCKEFLFVFYSFTWKALWHHVSTVDNMLVMWKVQSVVSEQDRTNFDRNNIVSGVILNLPEYVQIVLLWDWIILYNIRTCASQKWCIVNVLFCVKDNHLQLFEDFVMFVGGGGGGVEDVLLSSCSWPYLFKFTRAVLLLIHIHKGWMAEWIFDHVCNYDQY